MLLRAIVGVTVLLSWLAVTVPARACGDCGFSDELVLVPKAAASADGAEAYYVEFVGRANAVFGHSFIRLGVVGEGGGRRRIMDFGLYPANNSGGTTAALLGTRAMVGYTATDVRTRPDVLLRQHVSGATHRLLLGSVGRLSRTFPHFALLRTNCNHLTGHVARMLGLRTPANPIQRGDDYVRELKVLNARQAAH